MTKELRQQTMAYVKAFDSRDIDAVRDLFAEKSLEWLLSDCRQDMSELVHSGIPVGVACARRE